MNTVHSSLSSHGSPALGNPWPLLADESPLNDLDDAEDDIDALDDDFADALAEREDQAEPFADPGTP